VIDQRCRICKLRFTDALWCANADPMRVEPSQRCPITQQARPTDHQRRAFLMDEKFYVTHFDDDRGQR